MIPRSDSIDTWRPRQTGSLVIRWLLGAVFLFAAGSKLLPEPTAFADSIASFRILPAALVSPLALALPPFELMLGGALLLGYPRRLGACGALVLGVVFLTALAAAMVRGIPVDCGCFGPGPGLLPLTTMQRMWFDLGRDVLIVAGALILYRREAAATPTTPVA